MTRNRVLWVIQGLLALMFLFAGGVKLVMPADELVKQAPMLSAGFLRFVGVCEVLGGHGADSSRMLRIQHRLDAAGRRLPGGHHDRCRHGDGHDERHGDRADPVRGGAAFGVGRIRALAASSGIAVRTRTVDSRFD